MGDISEQARAKAQQLWIAADHEGLTPGTALARYIQQVSDAAKEVSGTLDPASDRVNRKILAPFILSDPVDPLGEALCEIYAGLARVDVMHDAARLRELLTKRGLKIVEAD